MREYIFKGISEATKKWIYGSLYKVNAGKAFILEDKYTSAVCPETICQYTGLPDRNGVKIFEKDLLRFFGDDGESDYKIIWNNKKQCYETVELGTGYSDNFDIWFAESSEVIGNIYDQEAKV